MEPRHHLHVSTEFLFILGLMILAVVGLILWAKARSRQQDREHEAHLARLKAQETEAMNPRRRGYYSYDRTSSSRTATGAGGGYTAPSAGYPNQPMQQAPVFVNNSNDGMLTGFLLGDLIGSSSRGSDRVIYENGPAPAPDSGSSFSGGSSDSGSLSSDSGFSYDSGSSSSSDSGSSSSDSGSSGGFDVSW